MNQITETNAAKINEYLDILNGLMDEVLALQSKIRNSVKGRDWSTLDNSTRKINEVTVEFHTMDQNFSSYLAECGIESNSDFYGMCSKFTSLVEKYNSLRQKLIKSKVENQALADYVKITNGFLQGFYDKALPQRKNVLYSKNGKLIKNRPESIVLNIGV
ncbi:MAG: hypothetical protein K5839_03755 [Treponemataceae bacterium]|nr:hypothetical protein [Treponemataceae bacterium]